MRSGFEIAKWIAMLQEKYGDDAARDYMNLPANEFIGRYGFMLNARMEQEQEKFEREHPISK